MANSADGTDGRGAPSLGKSVTSGKSAEGFGKGSNRGMPSGGTISGKVDASFGTKGVKGQTRNDAPGDGNTDRSQISKTGGRF